LYRNKIRKKKKKKKKHTKLAHNPVLLQKYGVDIDIVDVTRIIE
jgi:hypothetical protein